MPSDEYSSFGKGALKLKGGGGKVKKHKKKKDKVSDLEKALSTGETSGEHRDGVIGEKQVEKRTKSRSPVEDDEAEEGPVRQKTEAERRFEEAKKKKLLELAKSAAGRPELLKTHKERVEELNTYLSKLSEHHDMPKIGPG
ncbi:DUF1754-domain-containing protein [Coniochaeta ligniaria NRRL 30616]|uniref:DUF1754-domain-containing protein n=1 Tax=Coniochaeta ligniaria NRRL 30616 TaxID=1408157 RepID=A0A1J7IR21_9PEZI|nr:DUF1754-domain-containing protein [Coniochaeta ligniaria NRRL 30616]